MAKVSIATLDTASVAAPPPGISGDATVIALFNRPRDPIHLHLYRIEGGGRLHIAPPEIDCLGYVWTGEVEAGGRRMGAGSSFIVEHGAVLDVCSGADQSTIATFAASQCPDNQRAGGHVHLLPGDRVPRVAAKPGGGTSGGLHSDATCPTCELWLNENSITGSPTAPTVAEAARGIHAHGEDEVIFVTGGQIRLGTKLHGRGTAIAVSAETFYGFTPGPEGLHFITFRPAKPTGTRFPSGMNRPESDYWAEVGSPPFLEPVAMSSR